MSSRLSRTVLNLGRTHHVRFNNKSRVMGSVSYNRVFSTSALNKGPDGAFKTATSSDSLAGPSAAEGPVKDTTRAFSSFPQPKIGPLNSHIVPPFPLKEFPTNAGFPPAPASLPDLTGTLEADEDPSKFGEVVIPKGKTYQEAFSYEMPREAYFSEEIFKEEQTKIFSKSWVPIGYTSEFMERLNPNSNAKKKTMQKRVLCRELYGRHMLLTKSHRDGKIRVFHNMCRHRGHRLVKGADSETKNLICPYHSWRFRLDGSLASAPRLDVENSEVDFNKKDFGLAEIRSKVIGNIIVANFNNDAEDIEAEAEMEELYSGFVKDLSPYPMEDLKVVREEKFKIDANWKNLIDNFIEYLHLPSIHPGLVQVSTMAGHVCNQKKGKYIGFQTNPLTKANTPVDPDDQILGGPATYFNNAPNNSQFHALFPNMFWFILPNHIFSVIIDPQCANKSVESACLMVHKDVDEEKYGGQLDKMFEFYKTVNQEDIDAVEEVQKGLKDTPTDLQTVYVMPYEKTIRRFHRIWKAQMGERGEDREAWEDEV